jgi:hypothetical protein
MNYATARIVLAQAIRDVLPEDVIASKDVHWDNAHGANIQSARGIDLANARDLVLTIDFYWDDARQMNLGVHPGHRVAGSVWFTIFSRERTGSQAALALADHLTEALKFRNLAGLVTRVPAPGRRERHEGWQSREWRLPFFFDS